MDWAVIPAAGLGTRLMPATKSVPKELIPVLDRPTIQYSVDEAIASGVKDIVLVVSRVKQPMLEHYFSRDLRLEGLLRANGKAKLAEELAHLIPDGVRFHYVLQEEPLGLGHAILMAEPVIGSSAFAVLLPDEILIGNPPCTAQLNRVFKQTGKHAVATRKVPDSEVRHYGILEAGAELGPGVVQAARILEKPKLTETTSRLSLPGRYVFGPSMFHTLRKLGHVPGREIQLSEAISLAAQEGTVAGVEFVGDRFDVGNLEGLVNTNTELLRRRTPT